MKKFLPRTTNNPQGFTLVELLVVIAIIAILSVIGVTVFSGVQKNARDARRRADIDAIAAAVETHYVSGTGYTTPILGTWFSSGTIPKDPKDNTTDYIWATALSTTGYKVCADLASLGSTEGGSEQEYCRNNQQ